MVRTIFFAVARQSLRSLTAYTQSKRLLFISCCATLLSAGVLSTCRYVHCMVMCAEMHRFKPTRVSQARWTCVHNRERSCVAQPCANAVLHAHLPSRLGIQCSRIVPQMKMLEAATDRPWRQTLILLPHLRSRCSTLLALTCDFAMFVCLLRAESMRNRCSRMCRLRQCAFGQHVTYRSCEMCLAVKSKLN